LRNGAGVSELKRVGAIDVEQDLGFQREEWRFQTIGRIALAAIVLLGLVGAFGQGPLAHARRTSAAGDITVEYDRITRHRSNSDITFILPAHNGAVVIWIGNEYLENVQLKQVVPQPANTRSTRGRVEFTFNVVPPARIEFSVEPSRVLVLPLHVGVVGGSTLRLRQIVLP
jgi:hypothetical protein